MPQILCLFFAPRSTKCSTRCCSKLQVTDGGDQPDVVSTHKKSTKICKRTKRRTPQSKMFVFTENRTNPQRLQANSQDQNLVCYQMLYPANTPNPETHSDNQSGCGNRGVADTLLLLDGFKGALQSFFTSATQTLSFPRVIHAAYAERANMTNAIESQ